MDHGFSDKNFEMQGISIGIVVKDRDSQIFLLGRILLYFCLGGIAFALGDFSLDKDFEWLYFLVRKGIEIVLYGKWNYLWNRLLLLFDHLFFSRFLLNTAENLFTWLALSFLRTSWSISYLAYKPLHPWSIGFIFFPNLLLNLLNGLLLFCFFLMLPYFFRLVLQLLLQLLQSKQMKTILCKLLLLSSLAYLLISFLNPDQFLGILFKFDHISAQRFQGSSLLLAVHEGHGVEAESADEGYLQVDVEDVDASAFQVD